MPADKTLQSVHISTIAHATDDLNKVHLALRFILPESLKEQEIFTREYLQGHHGNPIVTFEARLSTAREVEQFAHHFASQLSKNEKIVIERDLENYTDDEGNLYIRINKQQAFRGLIELGDDDPIRLKLKFSRLKGDARHLMRQFLEASQSA